MVQWLRSAFSMQGAQVQSRELDPPCHNSEFEGHNEDQRSSMPQSGQINNY